MPQRGRVIHYSRRDFLMVAAAGLPFVGASWYFSEAARAGTQTSYDQAQADRIHRRSTEEQIRRSGEDPEEVKARVNRRIQELRAN
jgi:hypothetical protein